MRVEVFCLNRFGVCAEVSTGARRHVFQLWRDDVARLTLEWLAMALTLAAVWLIGAQDVRGQWLMLTAQGAWFVVARLRRSMALAVQSVVLAALTWRALWLWNGWGV